MQKKYPTLLLLLALSLIASNGVATGGDDNLVFEKFMIDFDKQYQELNMPGFDFDYRENLKHIPRADSLEREALFFKSIKKQLAAISPSKLSHANQVNYDHIEYEINLNTERIILEKAFIKDTARSIPAGGLSKLEKGWYQLYIHFFTSIDITPDELYRLGEKEVARIHGEISTIQKQLGYENDSAGFYKHLQSDDFVLTDKKKILQRYEAIKATVYKNIGSLFSDTDVTDITFMEWPGANKYTPPGYYSPRKDNASGTAIFFFNFYGSKHNTRSMEWLFMHEGVPGHHYQWCLRDKISGHPAYKDQFYYPGNTEGWAAYIEYSGKDMGLYRDPYSYLGKWEWDLVRSTRVLIDVGVHNKGWTKEQAIACWKQNIPGQDEIADREVTRCTNWPAQALSYKAGAEKIMEMREALKKKNGNDFDIRKFHAKYLSYGNIPLKVIEKDMLGDNHL